MANFTLQFHPAFHEDHAGPRIEDAHVPVAVETAVGRSDMGNRITLFLGRLPAGAPAEFALIVADVSPGDGGREHILVHEAHAIRGDLVDRVGHDPALVLQALCEDVGELVLVGDQRTKLVFSETVPLKPDGTAPQLVGSYHPGDAYIVDHFFATPGQVGGQNVVFVTLAYSLNDGRYREWLRQEQLPSHEYLTCFISYGEPDRETAKRIRDSLTTAGVDCWYYASDRTGGQRTWPEIVKQIHIRDRFLILCSAASLSREGSQRELEVAVDDDSDSIIAVSIDDIWTQSGFTVARGSRNLKYYLTDRNFVDLRDEKDFGKAINELLVILRSSS